MHSFISWSTISFRAVCSLPSDWRQTGLEGKGHVISRINWKMGQQGRQNCDNLKRRCMVAFVKTKNKIPVPGASPGTKPAASVLNPATPLSARQHTVTYMESVNLLGFPGGSTGKESACNAGDLGLIPGLGRSPGGGNGYPLQYSGLEKSMGCIVHGVAKNRTRLSDFHFHFVIF